MKNHRYTPEIPEPAPSLSRHGAQIGELQVFSCYQNNRGSSGAYALHLLWAECEDKTYVKRRMAWEDVDALVLHFFYVCGWQKPEDTQIEPHG